MVRLMTPDGRTVRAWLVNGLAEFAVLREAR